MTDLLPPSYGPIARNMRVWSRFLSTGQALTAAVEAELKAANLPPLGWYDVLLELQRAGAKGLRQFELRDRLLLAQYNLSRLLERIERAGYISRDPCPEDGRGQIARLTEAGAALQQRMWPVYRDTVARVFSARLTEPEMAAFGAVLDKLRPVED